MLLDELIIHNQNAENASRIKLSVREKLINLLDTEHSSELGWLIANLSSIELESKNIVNCLHLGEQNDWGVWKQPIFLGLLANQIARNRLNQETEILVEGGGVSTAYCLNKIADKVSFETTFITSRFYPDELLKKLVSSNVQLILAPEDPMLSIEEEFYTHLVRYVRSKRGQGKAVSSPWHVKWSQYVADIYADELIRKHSSYFSKVDYFVVSVGSGSTLAIAAKIKHIFKNIKIIVAEPQESPLIANALNLGIDTKARSQPDHSLDYLVEADNRITHLTFGPHYEKLNPKLKPNILSCVDSVITYNTQDWQNVSMFMRGMQSGVGNSTAACLSVADKLKSLNPKLNVLTVIYEPLRDYCLKDDKHEE